MKTFRERAHSTRTDIYICSVVFGHTVFFCFRFHSSVLMMWRLNCVVNFCFAFGLIFCADYIPVETPCSKLELPCDGSGCIRKGSWCDAVPDCSDRSDEMYCASQRNPRPKCLEHHFRCDDGTCIPFGAKCDNFPDCPDRSDEADRICSNRTRSVRTASNGNKNPDYDPIRALEVIKEGENWILSRRNGNYGWGDDTARAVVALYLIDQQRYEAAKEGDLMKKQLSTEITVDIVKNKTEEISISKLANYINSLIATCQSPDSFQGLDMTRQLRIGVDQQMRSNSTVVAPLVFLTLCLTEEFRHDDFVYLYRYYLRLEDQQKMDLQAVALMAMSCLTQRKSLRMNEKSSDEKLIESIAQRLAEKYEIRGKDLDVYTVALVIQALNAAGFENWDKGSALNRLVMFQQADGGFGDILATYYALPALAEKSLLSLKYTACNNRLPHGKGFLPRSSDEHKEIGYSLWFGMPVTGSHTMSLRIGANWTMLEVMRHAAGRNELFRFYHEETPAGPSVYSIADVPNDSEREFQWTLYRKSKHANAGSEQYTGQNLLPFDLRSKPNSGDNVIMWYKRVPML